jgi:Family of unknown function (DUF6279)
MRLVPRRLGRVAAAALLAAVLVGCSLIGIAYNNADQWLLYQADSYLDLRKGQREQLATALRERLAAHRSHELADYVDFLDRVQRAAADGLDAAEVDALAARLEGLVRTTVAGTLPAVADVLAGLHPDQIDHLQTALEEDDKRYRKGSVQPAAQRRADRQAKTAVRALEFWTGDLSEVQRARVVALVRTWPDVAGEWHAYRTARTAGLVELLRSRPGSSAIQRYLASRWLAHDGRSDTLAAGATALRKGIVELIVAVDGSLTAPQRTAFLMRVRTYRDQLAAQLPARGPAVADSRATEAVGAAH